MMPTIRRSMTPRLREALALFERDYSQQQIADEMGVSALTVKGYVTALRHLGRFPKVRETPYQRSDDGGLYPLEPGLGDTHPVWSMACPRCRRPGYIDMDHAAGIWRFHHMRVKGRIYEPVEIRVEHDRGKNETWDAIFDQIIRGCRFTIDRKLPVLPVLIPEAAD